MYDIIIGRSKKDYDTFGLKGTIFLGRQYVTMGRTTSLSNDLFLDVSNAHVVFVCGKRGGGKSYTMGVIAEGFATLDDSIKQNLSCILLDTMGIYWTMKYGNREDELLLNKWGLKAHPLDVTIFTPSKYYSIFKKEGIPTDVPFTIRTSLLDEDDWCIAFHQDKYEPIGVCITNSLYQAREKYGARFDLDDLIAEAEADTESSQDTRNAVKLMFTVAKRWGVFDKEGTDLSEIAKGGRISVLDLSCYATMPGGWDVKALVVGVLGQHLFDDRMEARKKEEYQEVRSSLHYFSEEQKTKQEEPLVWMVIDEAHEFLPKDRTVPSTKALVTILREGRQPGISLILASQQPGKIHTDVMTQSDTVISHRITAKVDIDALSLLMQSYMRLGLNEMLDQLSRTKGAALIFDDNNEKMYSIQVRPRFTWHGGSSPSAIKQEKKKIE